MLLSRDVYIRGILDMIGSEIIASLQDKSAHSISLYDEHNAEALADYLQSVMDGTHRILSVNVSDDIIAISKG